MKHAMTIAILLAAVGCGDPPAPPPPTECSPKTPAVSCSNHADCLLATQVPCDPGKAVCGFQKTGNTCTNVAIVFQDNLDKVGRDPSLACFTRALTPGTANVAGCIDPFGVTINTDNGLTVDIYDPGSLTTPLFHAVSQDYRTTLAGATPKACVVDTDCTTPGFKFCAPPVTAGASRVCVSKICASVGSFSITGVPTDKPLVVKIAGPAGSVDYQDTWLFNEMIEASKVVSGEAPLDISIISHTTYTTIPALLGLSSGIPPDQGALAGSVEDCTGNGVANVAVQVTDGSGAAPKKFGYFNSADDPKPDLKRKATHINGLYVGVGIAPGPVSVSVQVPLADGTMDLGGARTGQIFKNAVSIVSFHGPVK